MRLKTGFVTHQGLVRSSNQDAVAIVEPRRPLFGRPGLWLFVVADGMGGYQGGEIASSVAVQTMVRVFGQQSRQNTPAEALQVAFTSANQAILARAQDAPGLSRMGTTLVAATVTEQSVYLCNVGDSRAYLMHEGTIRQVTEDHSLVSEQVRAGLIQEDDPLARRNILTRSVGRAGHLKVDRFKEPWQPNDILLLCSDGLWGVLSDAQIAAVLAEMDPQSASEKLVQMAMISQSSDNISAVIVKRLA
ncbi:MAG: Stp1/IreP family PP2C-type Ser/Thr phosphatase [Anaerolineae bacterium]|nr:Stp1/IreP family PP2C-type Ser/Thr phosphatase [Anaerolineae bacterium]